MSLFRVDARFLLPAPPAVAAVDEDLAAWREALPALGTRVVERASPEADTAIARSRQLERALAARPRSVLAEGPGAAAVLGRIYPHVRRYVLHPGYERAHMMLPVDDPALLRYAITRWPLQESVVRRARNRSAAWALSLARVAEQRPLVTVASAATPMPYMLDAARAYGVPAGARWFLTLGEADELSRCVFHVFAPGEHTPAWVLKFSRLRGHVEPFERDEAGLRLVADLPVEIGAHVPRLLGRFAVDGLHASLETARGGQRLATHLRELAPRALRLRTVERIARWLIALGVASRTPADRLAPERRRLEQEILPLWQLDDAARPLLDALEGVPAVVEHRDPGAWNILADRRDFLLLDWESAVGHGFPLWDLLYFLADALATVDRAQGAAERDAHTLRLFRGELPASGMVFGLVRDAVSALSLPPDSVGPLAIAGWMHHGTSHRRRAARGEAHGAWSAQELPPIERIAPRWLRDPALGMAWSAWR